MDRLSSRTGITAAMSQGKAASGTVTWMPLAGRIEGGSRGSSNPRTSSDQTPAAFTTTDARTSNGSPSTGATVAPRTRPAASVTRPVTGAWLRAVAPWSSTAVRSTARVRRASSDRASQYRKPAASRSARRVGMWAMACSRVTFSCRRPMRTPPVRS